MGRGNGDLSRHRLTASLHQQAASPCQRPLVGQPTPAGRHDGSGGADGDAAARHGPPEVLPDRLELRAAGQDGPEFSAIRTAARLGRGRPWWLLVLVAVVAIGLTALVWWRGAPAPTDAADLRVLDPGIAVAPAPAAQAPLTQMRVVIHLVGRVRHPGVVSLPAGSRLAQAVAAAGGLLPGTAVTGVNLARRLVDGEQVAIGVTATTADGSGAAGGGSGVTSGAGGPATAEVVDLNQATAEQLDSLPRVGPATAAKIIEYRSRHGPFRSVEQLLDVPGIGEATLANLRDRVRV